MITLNSIIAKRVLITINNQNFKIKIDGYLYFDGENYCIEIDECDNLHEFKFKESCAGEIKESLIYPDSKCELTWFCFELNF
jgi:hypothetical protein